MKFNNFSRQERLLHVLENNFEPDLELEFGIEKGRGKRFTEKPLIHPCSSVCVKKPLR